jgi:regulator of replication initiation timing
MDCPKRPRTDPDESNEIHTYNENTISVCPKRPRTDPDESNEIHTYNENTISIYQHHIHHLQSESQKQLKTLQLLKADNETLIAGTNTTIRALEQEMGELKKNKCDLEKDNNELTVKTRNTTTRMNQLLEANTRIADKNKDLKKSNIQAIGSENTEVLDQAISNFEKQMANLKKENSKLQNNLKDLKVENSAFRTENAQLREFQANVTVFGKPCESCLEFEGNLRTLKVEHFQAVWSFAILLQSCEFYEVWDFVIQQRTEEILDNLRQAPSFSDPIQEHADEENPVPTHCSKELELELNELKTRNLCLQEQISQYNAGQTDWQLELNELKTRNLCLQEQISQYNAGQTDWQLVGNINNTDVQLPLEQSQNVMQPLGTTDSQAATQTIPSNFEIEDCTLEGCTLDDLKGFLDDVQMVTPTDSPSSN